MTILNEYQKLAERTECNQNLTVKRIGENGLRAIRLLHAGIGLNAESAELRAGLHSYKFDEPSLTNLKEELGDLFWYLAEACNALGVTIHQVYTIAKNRQDLVRYPDVVPLTGQGHLMLRFAVDCLDIEGGNYLTLIQRWLYYGKPLDETEIALTLGRIFHSALHACIYLGTSYGEIMEANLRKLRTRYPEKFSEVLAAEENRDRAAEARAIDGTGTGYLSQMCSSIKSAPEAPGSCKCGEELINLDKREIDQVVAENGLWDRRRAVDDGPIPVDETARDVRVSKDIPREIEQCPNCRGPLSDEMLKALRAKKRDVGQCPNCMKKFVLNSLNELIPITL